MVTATDVNKEKVDFLNKLECPIHDDYIEKCFYESKNGVRNLNLRAVWNNNETGSKNPSNKIYADADFVIVATPTNYDSEKNFFDTSSVESVIEQAMDLNDHCFIVIKSTVPVGYTEGIRKNIILIGFYLARNSFENRKHYTIIYTLVGLSLDGIKMILRQLEEHKYLQNY